uniref:interactor of constitutive active ROPs 3-like isoform X2 n=1 Tax=Erigeron canadensis TaxID=72917 RepID=UPI001CB96EFB|nr:interactor of constitutive active ROPs 3-like isoform X2 [Erigeron canadensis]
MQNPKTSLKGSSGSEGDRRNSPRSVSSGRVVRQVKTTRLEGNSTTSLRTPKASSPKIVDRASPRSPALEKKRVGRVAELETQVTQLEDALRTVKDQLIVSESWKKQAKLDAEESRKELLAMTLRLEESENILARSSPSESHDVQKLQDDNDDEEQKLKTAESAALAAALLEIEQLKVKLDTTSKFESKQVESAYAEIHILKENMAEKLSLMEEMKNELEESKSSESQAQALASETLLQLETAKKTMEALKTNSDEYNAILLELEHSKARVRTLEGIINEMKSTYQVSGTKGTAEIKFHEEEPGQTSDIMAELKKSKANIVELKANLMDKETELQCVLEENENLHAKLANMISSQQENELTQKFKSLETELCTKSEENEKLKLEIHKLNGVMEATKQEFDTLKSKLISLETELCEKSNESEKFKMEIKKMSGVVEDSKQDFDSLESKLTTLKTESCEKSNENEKLKLETKKSNDEAAQVTEQLETVKTANCELEEELRKLKLQMGQWRKAAEAATAMLCDENSNNNGRTLADRTWSMGHFSPMKKLNMGSPRSVDIDDDNDDGDDTDEFLKRKNVNVLKRIGVLWKKPQNK